MELLKRVLAFFRPADPHEQDDLVEFYERWTDSRREQQDACSFHHRIQRGSHVWAYCTRPANLPRKRICAGCPYDGGTDVKPLPENLRNALLFGLTYSQDGSRTIRAVYYNGLNAGEVRDIAGTNIRHPDGRLTITGKQTVHPGQYVVASYPRTPGDGVVQVRVIDGEIAREVLP